ncbi:MAG: NADH-quinone oxidoreductase subunit NuoH [Candidatus Hydrogenedentota bacterium]|nr:MAG: NADH-quinone oxidoreductase subunit NuoH [Candidatus Hydrogenedentota bacterium]
MRTLAEIFIIVAVALLKVLIVFGALQVTIMYMILAERRVSGFMQDRLGPNRVGWQGMLQPVADGLKFLFKEDIIPSRADKVIFVIAPAMIVVPAFMTFAAIPFGDTVTIAGREVRLQIAGLNIGLLYVLAMGSISVYGIIFGSWASANKYSMMGGLRSCAQMISYEIPLGLSVMGVLMLTGSLRLERVVEAQTAYLWGVVPRWNILFQPLAFLLFLISAMAENNRLPFDLPEAEQELVAGYHTEYSSIKFAMYFMAEYAAMVTSSALVVILFLGGWHVPGLGAIGLPALLEDLIQVGAFVLKVGMFLFLYLWVRWTLPRFRYDQLMRLCWKVLLPLALANIFVTGIVMTV